MTQTSCVILAPDDRERLAAIIANRNRPQKLGDVATFRYEFQLLMGDRATARGFDNKMGSFTVTEALRLLKRKMGYTLVLGSRRSPLHRFRSRGPINGAGHYEACHKSDYNIVYAGICLSVPWNAIVHELWDS
jgi:hypothetical protein